MELFGDLQGLKRDKKEKLRGVNPMALIFKPNFVPPGQRSIALCRRIPIGCRFPSKVLNIVQLLVLGLTLLPC